MNNIWSLSLHSTPTTWLCSISRNSQNLWNSIYKLNRVQFSVSAFFFILHNILYIHPCCSKRPNLPLHRWVIFLFSPYVSYFLYVLIHLNSHLFLYTAIMENDAINMTNQIFSGFDFISFEFIFKTGSSVWILEKALLFKVTYILPQWSTLVDFSLDAYP